MAGTHWEPEWEGLSLDHTIEWDWSEFESIDAWILAEREDGNSPSDERLVAGLREWARVDPFRLSDARELASVARLNAQSSSVEAVLRLLFGLRGDCPPAFCGALAQSIAKKLESEGHNLAAALAWSLCPEGGPHIAALVSAGVVPPRWMGDEGYEWAQNQLYALADEDKSAPWLCASALAASRQYPLEFEPSTIEAFARAGVAQNLNSVRAHAVLVRVLLNLELDPAAETALGVARNQFGDSGAALAELIAALEFCGELEAQRDLLLERVRVHAAGDENLQQCLSAFLGREGERARLNAHASPGPMFTTAPRKVATTFVGAVVSGLLPTPPGDESEAWRQSKASGDAAFTQWLWTAVGVTGLVALFGLLLFRMVF